MPIPRGAKRLARELLDRAVRRPVRWESLRRLEPASRTFGLDRGRPIDRYYIERFLQRHAADIRGRVMEIGDATYIRRFGGAAVERAEVLHVAEGNAETTIVGDLATGRGVPDNVLDCILLTQTLPFIYDLPSAVQNIFRALRPAGVVLATVPGISQISRYDMDRWGDFWRFTDASARRLFGEAFGGGNVAVDTYGNVLVATAFLQGLATEELTETELDHRDTDYQVLITIRAVKR